MVYAHSRREWRWPTDHVKAGAKLADKQWELCPAIPHLSEGELVVSSSDLTTREDIKVGEVRCTSS